MNELQIFENAEFGSVRTMMVNDNPYFVGKDVAEILGYERPTKAVNDHVDADDRDVVPIQDSIGRMQNTPVINESGLYSLILSSKMPNAKKFKHWVTAEVLPSIRKTGGYIAGQEQLTDAELMAKALMVAKKTIESRTAEIESLKMTNAVQQQQIAELKPKADYTDRILNNKGLVNANQIAKDYGMSARTLNRILHELGVQYKEGDQWLLYHKYQDKGYTFSETVDITRSDGRADVKMRTKWTQKGRLFLYDKLKKHGYLPTIEQKENKRIG